MAAAKEDYSSSCDDEYEEETCNLYVRDEGQHQECDKGKYTAKLEAAILIEWTAKKAIGVAATETTIISKERMCISKENKSATVANRTKVFISRGSCRRRKIRRRSKGEYYDGDDHRQEEEVPGEAECPDAECYEL